MEIIFLFVLIVLGFLYVKRKSSELARRLTAIVFAIIALFILLCLFLCERLYLLHFLFFMLLTFLLLVFLF